MHKTIQKLFLGYLSGRHFEHPNIKNLEFCFFMETKRAL